MENKSQLEQSFGTFNMETSTIDFNGITYDYTKEQLCSDNQLTYSQFNDNKSNGIFPQGESYIESIIQSEEKVIILESKINEQTAWFYFPLIKYEDLCYSEVYRMVDKNRVKSKFDEYETDNYPQGREYCQELINNGLNKGECFYIIARQNGEKWTRYYFKSEYIKINPDEVSLLTGKDQLKNALDFISNNNNDNFPQNKAKCIDIINSQIESDGEVFVLESSEPNSNKKTWHYLLQEEIMRICDHVGRNKSDSDKIERVKEKESNPSKGLPQGSKYCIDLLEKLLDTGGFYRIFILKSKTKTFFFYFNDN